MDNSYLKLAYHYHNCFEKHGATPKGLDWDNQENLNKRYQIMSELFIHDKNKQVDILDFGCGYGGFYEYLIKNYFNSHYIGLDINENTLRLFQNKYPELNLYLEDIHLIPDRPWEGFPSYDYIICNGTFTVKGDMTQREMTNFMCSTLEKLWTKTNKGIAFNCMSKVLDYERDDLFHVSFDELSMWVYDNLSSKFTIRQDYGLREFTIYVYK